MALDLNNYPPNGRYRCVRGTIRKHANLIYFDGETLDENAVGYLYLDPLSVDNNGNALTFTMTNAEPYQIAFLVEQKKVIARVDGSLEAAEGTPIPDGFPGRRHLIKDGYEFVETLPVTLNGLVTIPGIGGATANEILKELESYG